MKGYRARVPYMFEKKKKAPAILCHLLNIAKFQQGKAWILAIFQLIFCIRIGTTFSLGFIFNNLCGYSTDVKDMPEKISINCDCHLIVESLRETEHQAHAHYDLTFS